MGDLAKLNPVDYGQWLRSKREAYGLSRAEFAELSAMHSSTILSYEKNITLPNMFNRAKIDNAFDEIEAQQGDIVEES